MIRSFCHSFPLRTPLWLFICVCLASLIIVGCQRTTTTREAIPTPIRDLDVFATAQFMTVNAPPEGYRGPVSFPFIDDNLSGLTNWRYQVYLAFDGVFSRTARQVSVETTTQVWYNDTGPERRVVTQGRGDLFGIIEEGEEAPVIEGVRLANDTYLVRDGVCLTEVDDEASIVADLRAGELIGGVAAAQTEGINATINAQRVWRYEFAPEAINLPQVRFMEDGQILDLRSDLWVSPEHNIVIRYYVTMALENAIIFDSALPVSGDLVLQYDVYDIGLNPNITVPFGC